jgi:hypothetical protein
VAVNCLALMTLKPKSSRLPKLPSAGVSGGKVTDYCRGKLFGIRGAGKIVEIIFLHVGFHC